MVIWWNNHFPCHDLKIIQLKKALLCRYADWNDIIDIQHDMICIYIYMYVHINNHKYQVNEIWLHSTHFKFYLILFDDSMMALAGPFGIGNRSCIVAAIGNGIIVCECLWSLLNRILLVWDHAKIMETCFLNKFTKFFPLEDPFGPR